MMADNDPENVRLNTPYFLEWQDLKLEIEDHFAFYNDNDRSGALLENEEYFEGIPTNIQEFLMTKFLYNDILSKPNFQPFLNAGMEFDA